MDTDNIDALNHQKINPTDSLITIDKYKDEDTLRDSNRSSFEKLNTIYENNKLKGSTSSPGLSTP